MGLLQVDSGEKVVHQPESEMLLAKHLKLHNLLMPCLGEYLKCFSFVVFVGCYNCLLG